MNRFKPAFIGMLITLTLLPSDRSKPAQAAGAGALAKSLQLKQPLNSLAQAHARLDAQAIKSHIDEVNNKIQDGGSKPKLSVCHPRLAGEGTFSVNCIAWSPNNKLFATGSNYNARIWDTQGNLKHTLDHAWNIKAIAWSTNAQSIATATESPNPAVCVWDVKTGAKQATFQHHEPVSTVQWSKNNQWLFSCTDDHAYVWRVNPPEHKVTVEVNGPTPPVSFSPDCQSIAIAAKDDVVHVYDLESGKLKAQLKHPWHVKRIAWNQSCDSLCISCQGNFADFLYHWSLNPVAFKGIIQNNNYFYSIAWDNEGKPKPIPLARPYIPNKSLLQPMKGIYSAQLHWSPNRMHAINNNGHYAQLWDTAHLRDPQFLEQYSLLEANRLTPAQTMLLVLVNCYSHTSHEVMNLRRTPPPQPILADMVERAQADSAYKGLTIDECAVVLRTLHPTLRQMIINAYDIQDAHRTLGIQEYAQAQKVLFDRNTPVLNDGPGKPEGPVQNALREYLMGGTPPKAAPAVEDDEEALLEKRIDAAIQLALQQEQTKVQTTKALFAGINNCDEKAVRENLNHVTVVARNPDLHHRTPLMEVIWKSEKRYSDYDKIFNALLTFKKYYRFDRYNYEERTSELDAQDMEGNTPLMIAILKNRFDYALKIAKMMTEDDKPDDDESDKNKKRRLVKALAFTNNISKKTALNLMQDQKDKCAGNEQFDQLYLLLEKHDKIVM